MGVLNEKRCNTDLFKRRYVNLIYLAKIYNDYNNKYSKSKIKGFNKAKR